MSHAEAIHQANPIQEYPSQLTPISLRNNKIKLAKKQFSAGF